MDTEAITEMSSYIIMTIASASLIGGSLLLFLLIWTSESKIRSLLINIFLLVNTTAIFATGLEYAFYYLITPSCGYSFTLSHQRWVEKNWHPINSLGFRDDEHSLEEAKSKRVLFVVGDSFVAGHGVANYKNRFGNQLGDHLGPDWQVHVMGHNGWNTSYQVRGLKKYPFKPNEILLSYFVNDINESCIAAGVAPKTKKHKTEDGWASYFIDNYYAINYIYWRYWRFKNSYYGQVYWDSLKECFDDKLAWEKHTEELQSLIDYADENDAKLNVVIFPHLLDIEGSLRLTKKVKKFFRENEHGAIDFSELLQKRETKDLVVNALNAHPSEELNIELAKIIFQEFFEDSDGDINQANLN